MQAHTHTHTHKLDKSNCAVLDIKLNTNCEVLKIRCTQRAANRGLNDKETRRAGASRRSRFKQN